MSDCLVSSRVSALVAEMKVLEAFFAKSEAEAPPEAPLKKAKLGEARRHKGSKIEGSYRRVHANPSVCMVFGQIKKTVSAMMLRLLAVKGIQIYLTHTCRFAAYSL